MIPASQEAEGRQQAWPATKKLQVGPQQKKELLRTQITTVITEECLRHVSTSQCWLINITIVTEHLVFQEEVFQMPFMIDIN